MSYKCNKSMIDKNYMIRKDMLNEIDDLRNIIEYCRVQSNLHFCIGTYDDCWSRFYNDYKKYYDEAVSDYIELVKKSLEL